MYGSLPATALEISAGGTFDVSELPATYTFPAQPFTATSSGGNFATIKGNSTVDLSAAPITLNYDGSNPALYISQGALVLNGNTFTVNAASPLTTGTYPLIQQAAGNIVSNGTFTVTGTAIPVGAAITVTGGTVNLVVPPLNAPPVIATPTITLGAQSGLKQTLQILNNTKYPITDADSDPLNLSSVNYTGGHGATVQINGDSVEYTALPTYLGSDSFTYTVSDGQGGTATGTVNVTVMDPNSINQKADITWTAGNLNLKFWGIPGVTYTIQRSADLTTWTNIATVQASTAAGTMGQILHTDTDHPTSGSGFYRLKP